MKTILLLLVSTISLSLGQYSPYPVHDIDGNVLLSETQYYILPREMGGGLTLAATRNKSCPLDVVQGNLEDDIHLSLTFISVDPKKDVIRESTDLNIIFSGSEICNQSNVWMLEGYGRELVITGRGVLGNPGLVTITNWFKIEKYEDDYKLVFCPMVCDHCTTACGDIGVIVAENGRRRLAISNMPLKITFKKAY